MLTQAWAQSRGPPSCWYTSHSLRSAETGILQDLTPASWENPGSEHGLEERADSREWEQRHRGCLRLSPAVSAEGDTGPSLSSSPPWRKAWSLQGFGAAADPPERVRSLPHWR